MARRLYSAQDDTPVSTWVVVWFDPSYVVQSRQPEEWHTELWDNEGTAKSVAAVYRTRGYRAWAVRLAGDGSADG